MSSEHMHNRSTTAPQRVRHSRKRPNSLVAVERGTKLENVDVVEFEPVRLRDWNVDGNLGRVTIIGTLDPGSLKALQVDSYQRQPGKQPKIDGIIDRYEKNTCPPIALAVRNNLFTIVGEDIQITGPVYIMDGVSRTEAVRQLAQRKRGNTISVKVVVYLDTDYKFERDYCWAEGTTPTKISRNIMLKGMIVQAQTVRCVYRLCTDPKFILSSRVCWSQDMEPTHFQNAGQLYLVCSILHHRFGADNSGWKLLSMVNDLENIIDRGFPLDFFEANVREFFDLLNDAYKIEKAVIKSDDYALVLKTRILKTIAQIISDFDIFWDGSRLNIPPEYVLKLRTFPLNSSETEMLELAADKTRSLLYSAMVKHLGLS